MDVLQFEYRGETILVGGIRADDDVGLLLADDLTDGIDQHERQAILDDAAYHRGITDLKRYLIQIRRLSNESVVMVRVRRTTAYLEDGYPIFLSVRDMEMLALIAQGKSNQEISTELYLALNMVKRNA